MTTEPCSLDVWIIKISSVGGKIGGPLMAPLLRGQTPPL
jgi:hypothetical protein